MRNEKLDFTNTFRHLNILDLDSLNEWKTLWHKRLGELDISLDHAVSLMNTHNPSVIPRNHMVEKILQASKAGDFEPLHELLGIIKTPYETHEKKYSLPPEDNERVLKTYCGT